MRLWTIQAEAAYRCLAERGEYTADPSFRDPDFLRPYQWMLDQMSRHLPPVAPRPAAAIWAWRKWNPPKRNRPDLRACGHLPSGCIGYRIELEVDPSQVLLSDFNLWHHVLNYYYVPASQSDSRRFDAEHAPFRFGWSCLPPKPLHDLIATSWERIFELDWHDEYVTGDPASRPVQATLWRIDRSMVCSSRRFVAR